MNPNVYKVLKYASKLDYAINNKLEHKYEIYKKLGKKYLSKYYEQMGMYGGCNVKEVEKVINDKIVEERKKYDVKLFNADYSICMTEERLEEILGKFDIKRI